MGEQRNGQCSGCMTEPQELNGSAQFRTIGKESPCLNRGDLHHWHPLYGGKPVLENARLVDVTYGAGCVAELSFKHFLALNLRKLRGAESNFAPRSYILQEGNHFEYEFTCFARDFRISQALALAKHVVGCWEARSSREISVNPRVDVNPGGGTESAAPPEGLWGREEVTIDWELGPDPSQTVDDASVEATLTILHRVVHEWQHGDRTTQLPYVTDDEWACIRCFSPSACVADLKQCAMEKLVSLLRDIPIELQASLLHRNVWAMKPSCGQFGRGILLFDRMPLQPMQLLQWATAVGRGGLKATNDRREGCVLQKLVERPHLLNPDALGKPHGSIEHRPQATVASNGFLFKYNLRMWLVASLREPVAAFLYKEGYISVSMHPFTSALDPRSHITNLRYGGKSSGAEERRWPIKDFRELLANTVGISAYESRILPQVHNIVERLFHALSLPPTALSSMEECSGQRVKLRRLGLDLLVDETLTVWLIEVNFLKNGYATNHAPKGAAGEGKRCVVRQLLEDETQLRITVAEDQWQIPDAFEMLLPRNDAIARQANGTLS